jgi:multidrug efflux pump subunit AcrA (membrane-fusion protein)
MKLVPAISLPQEPTARRRFALRALIGAGVLVLILIALLVKRHGAMANSTPAEPSPALTVTVTSAERVPWPQVVEASGAIAAWQEAVIGARVSGLPLAEVNVNVGDVVRRGQVLARFDTSMVRAELAEAEARLVQARAETKQAAVNRDPRAHAAQFGRVERAADPAVRDPGGHRAGAARRRRSVARGGADQAREHACRRAGRRVISARGATLGQVANAGSGAELFKLIRQGRLEWRGELTPAQLGRIHVGNPVLLTLPDGTQARATIRQLAPSARPDVAVGHRLRRHAAGQQCSRIDVRQGAHPTRRHRRARRSR